jgi:hypothetical protein
LIYIKWRDFAGENLLSSQRTAFRKGIAPHVPHKNYLTALSIKSEFHSESRDRMTLEEYLRTILDDEEMELVTLEPAYTFNLEDYEETSHE